MQRNGRFLAVGIFVPIVAAVGLGVGIPVLGSALFSTPVPIGVFVGSWLLARSIYLHLSKNAVRRVRKVARAIRQALMAISSKENE